MKNKINVRGRRSIRLKGWDYSSPNFYFITLCTQNREYLFGDILNREMTLNAAGEMVRKELRELPSRFNILELDEYIIMPNHVHAILHILCRGESCIRPEPCVRPRSYILPKPAIHSEDQGNHKDRPYGTESKSIGRIIQAYKSITTQQYIKEMEKSNWPEFHKRLWQRNYFEHITRSEKELEQIRQYIIGNPTNWPNDEENPFREKQLIPGDSPF